MYRIGINIHEKKKNCASSLLFTRIVPLCLPCITYRLVWDPTRVSALRSQYAYPGIQKRSFALSNHSLYTERKWRSVLQCLGRRLFFSPPCGAHLPTCVMSPGVVAHEIKRSGHVAYGFLPYADCYEIRAHHTSPLSRTILFFGYVWAFFFPKVKLFLDF